MTRIGGRGGMRKARHKALLETLNDRKFITMEWLANHLGVSVTTIWRDIEELRPHHPIVSLVGPGGGVLLDTKKKAA